jgi:acyl carrier protein
MTDRPVDGDAVAGVDVAAALLSIWQSVLGTAASATDSFFELGGDSFTALRVLGRIRDELGCDVSVADLLDYPEFGEFTVIVQKSLAQVRHADAEPS